MGVNLLSPSHSITATVVTVVAAAVLVTALAISGVDVNQV